eukprot:Gb_23814 [translate_table: standard]
MYGLQLQSANTSAPLETLSNFSSFHSEPFFFSQEKLN